MGHGIFFGSPYAYSNIFLGSSINGILCCGGVQLPLQKSNGLCETRLRGDSTSGFGDGSSLRQPNGVIMKKSMGFEAHAFFVLCGDETVNSIRRLSSIWCR